MAESTQCMAQRLTLHDEICERVAGLAPSPVAVRILEILRSERAPVQRLADVIATDPLLAVRLLKLANLAAGRPQRLITMSLAITVMGVDAIKSLALGLTTFPLPSVPGKTDDATPMILRSLCASFGSTPSVAPPWQRGLRLKLITFHRTKPLPRDFCTIWEGCFCIAAPERGSILLSLWLRLRVFRSPKLRPWR